MLSIPNLYIDGSVKDRMTEIASKSRQLETGGLVLGKIRRGPSGSSFFVTEITGPGPKSRRSKSGFKPDIAFYKRFLKKHQDLDYIGEWHKHPPGHIWLSPQDISQATKIFETEGRNEILCPILIPKQKDKGILHYEMHCFYIHKDLGHFINIPYTLLTRDMISGLTSPVIRKVMIEDRIIRNFIDSADRSRLVPARLYSEDGLIQLYNIIQNTANTQALLIKSAEFSANIDIPGDIPLYITVTPNRSLKVKAYWIPPSPNPEAKEISCELINPLSGVFIRNSGFPETRFLKDKHVGFIGVGSIGSNAAMELARAGVSRFTLIDPDIIEVSNLCRHLCELSDVGRLKVRAVAEKLMSLGTEARVSMQPLDITEDPEATLDICRKTDLLIVSTDTERSRRLANWISHQASIPVIFAGAMENADGGRVWRVVPKVTGCYNCYPGLDNVPLNKEIPYSKATDERDLTVQPGLGNDIAFITHIAVRYAIETLKDPKSLSMDSFPYNMTFWFNREKKDQEIGPLEIIHVRALPPRSDCEFCSA